MPTYSNGVPIHKAVIVRHTPRDHASAIGGKNTGAIPISGASVSSGLDYIGREGRYGEKSDIDRTSTPYDEALVADRLDYIGRLGRYIGKGAGRQEDATYWDQHGPVDRAIIEERILASGGAFVDSIVAVKREHMQALGIESKEDMQRLLRSTWQRNVEKWGAIRNPGDIRWVACYHTDADRSVHAHIYTWSARGEIAPGYTVSREGTRAGKEEIYRVAYAAIREERNTRRNFIRDLARFEAMRQLGLPVPREDERRLAATARRQGLSLRLSKRPDISREGREKVTALLTRLKGSLAHGQGSLSRNWEAHALSRDIIRILEKESPAFSKLSSSHRECAELMADLKGYGDSGFARERTALVKGEREDFLKRITGRLERAIISSDDSFRERIRLARDPHGHRVMGRAIRRPFIAYQTKASRQAASRVYGASLKTIRAMERDIRTLRASLARERMGKGERLLEAHSIARSYADKALQGNVLQEALARSAAERSAREGIPAHEAYQKEHSQFVGSFSKAVVDRITEDLRRYPEDGRSGDAISMVTGLASVLESAARSLEYSAIRGGMRGERDRSLERGHDERDRSGI